MRESIWSRVQRWLGHDHILLIAMLAAFALASPVLFTGFQIDDFHDYSWALNRPLSLLERPQLTPDMHAQSIERGRLPWWASPNVKPPSQLRPLGAVGLWLDLRFWPGQPLPAHAHSLLVYLLAVLAVGVFYRELMGRGWVAGAATVMYAIDDAHGSPISYIHTRSLLVAVIFVALTGWAFVRQRRDAWRPGWVLGPLFMTLGLLTYEGGVLALALLLPYALVLDDAPLRSRIAGIAPYLGVAALWMWLYSSGASGSHGSGMYADPLSEPVRFARHVAEQLPLYLASTLGFLPTDPFLLFTQTQLRVGWVIAVIMILGLLGGLVGLLRGDRESRYFALVLLLGVLPACAAFPNDRLLMVGQIGAFGLVARCLDVWWSREAPPRALRVLGGVFVGCHFLVAALVLPARVVAMDYTVGHAQRSAFAKLAAMGLTGDEPIVVLNAPDALMAATPGLAMIRGDIPRSRGMILGISRERVRVTRVDERTLTLAPESGYLADMTSTFLRSRDERFEVGHEARVLGHLVRVDAITRDGMPAVVRFEAVGASLDELQWLVWDDDGVRLYTPPAVGTHDDLPPVDYFRLFAH